MDLFYFDLFAKWVPREISARGLAGQRVVSTVDQEDRDIVFALASVMETVREELFKCPHVTKQSATVSFGL